MNNKEEFILNVEDALIEKYNVVREYDCITMSEFLNDCRASFDYSFADCHRIYDDLMKWEQDNFKRID